MSTYLLIHGAGHDGWCWNLVTQALTDAGHTAVAPDLPCDDPNAGLDDYARVARATVADGTRDLVVVGHSLGALAATLLATQLAAARLVFVAGIVGEPGMSLQSLAVTDHDRDIALLPSDFAPADDDCFRFTEAGGRRALYHDCPATLADEACRHLRLQRSLWTEPLDIATWPASRRTSVVCRDDRVVNPDWSRRVARERLGVEPIEIDGGHSPMLSRPAELTRILLDS